MFCAEIRCCGGVRCCGGGRSWSWIEAVVICGMIKVSSVMILLISLELPECSLNLGLDPEEP